MKKLPVYLAMLIASAAYAQEPAQAQSPTEPDCATAQCDSINIPVYIVDGVEVQSLDGITPDDVTNIEIIKTPSVTRIFSPRLGGIILITTKSKRFLKPIIEDYNKKTEEQRQQRIPGEIRIR